MKIITRTTKIITLHQPWASLIALGLKKYETRSWGTDYRGKLLIHAAKRPFIAVDGFTVLDKDADYAWRHALELAYENGILNGQSKLPSASELPLGCVVAIVDLTECYNMISVPNCLDTSRTRQSDNPTTSWDGGDRYSKIWIETVLPLEQAVGDWQAGRYAWKLENIQPLFNPIHWKGAQGGLRNAPSELIELVDQQFKAQIKKAIGD